MKKTEKGLSEEIEIKRGVRQGCVMSPSHFNLYTENIFRESKDIEGICIGGMNINNLRYADDTALIADKVETLQKNLDSINQIGKDYFNTKMNRLKRKVMVVTKQERAEEIKVKLDEYQLEQVDKFIYLGQTITNDGRCEEEIKKRIAIAKNQFSRMKNVLTNKTNKICN
ncbi:LINE-1 retrotransposable element ORF2 protein [Nymphon striatum]|nr:LINE-1 retrotransposable element ORF2 protein [Nymphon striatum]